MMNIKGVIMTCKMLFFDYRESEKPFFDKNQTHNFEIKLFSKSLNRKTVREIDKNDLEKTSILNIYTPSIISADIVNMFPNLRVIASRSSEVKNIDLEACLERNVAVVNVEILPGDNDSKIVYKSINAVTSVFCGCKDYRIV